MHVHLEGLVRLNHGNAAGPCGSDPSPARQERREGTKGEEQPLRAARQRLEAHSGAEAMQTSLVLFPALRRQVQEQQPHTQKWTLCRGRPAGLGGRPDGAGLLTAAEQFLDAGIGRHHHEGGGLSWRHGSKKQRFDCTG